MSGAEIGSFNNTPDSTMTGLSMRHPPIDRSSTTSVPSSFEEVLVERKIGDEPLQSVIFFHQLLEPPQFAHPQMGVLFLPGIERASLTPSAAPDKRRVLQGSSSMPCSHTSSTSDMCHGLRA
jgi:hypothetical protein